VRSADGSAAAELERRPLRDDVAPDPGLPADTALWARLQSASGGLWGGAHDQHAIVELLTRLPAASCRP
jgi:hypothetical protein